MASLSLDRLDDQPSLKIAEVPGDINASGQLLAPSMLAYL
jgi:hypothetical protein